MEEKLITIASFNETIEAHFAKDILNDEGVECFIIEASNRWTSKVKYELKVKPRDAKRASSLIHKEEEF